MRHLPSTLSLPNAGLEAVLHAVLLALHRSPLIYFPLLATPGLPTISSLHHSFPILKNAAPWQSVQRSGTSQSGMVYRDFDASMDSPGFDVLFYRVSDLFLHHGLFDEYAVGYVPFRAPSFRHLVGEAVAK